MRQIAVLLTVHNRKDKTLLCLKNLYAQIIPQGYEMEVYLTDDGCTDGTPEAVKVEFPQVHIVKGDGNLYWNRGMYAAWEEAAKKDFDFYLWLNDDTFTYPDMMESLVEVSNGKEHKAIIVGATRSLDYSRVTYGGRMKGGRIPVPNGDMVKVDYFNGNIVLIPRYVYGILGNLDAYFTHSKGDFDYGMRAAGAGIEMYQAGKYLGECDLHKTLDKWCDPNIPFKQRWRMLNRPNGMPPKETFHLEKRHKGLGIALFHYVTVHIRCLFPGLWVRYRK